MGLLLLGLSVTACERGEATADAAPGVTAAADARLATAISLDDSLSTPIKVRIATAATSPLDAQATVTGTVQAFRKATVAAEVSGRVVARLVEPGDLVEPGQVLVRLDNERARIAQTETKAQLSARHVDLAQAQSEYQRGVDLHAKEFISEDALDTLRFAQERASSQLAAAEAAVAAANRTRADTRIRTPFMGTAERVHVQQGDFLAPGTQVVTLTDFTKARIQAGVTAREATLLAQSKTAEVTLEALGPRRFAGDIRSISRIPDPATGTYTVEVWLDGAFAPLREGMVATVHMPYFTAEQRLAVPVSAVFRRNGAMHVFAVQDNEAHLRAVRTGRTDGTLIEIEDGLSEGAAVVIDGQFALRDGAAVQVEGY
ncbi:MAG: efflux RND transporter periplasmic adaptor subunit [Pseudomonadales bacterium]